jgi:hypothetical protein
MNLDQLREAGEWDQDYYPLEQTTGAAGPGNRLTSETTMPTRPRSHSESQRDGHRLHATLATGSTDPAEPLAGHGDVVPTRDHTHIEQSNGSKRHFRKRR